MSLILLKTIFRKKRIIYVYIISLMLLFSSIFILINVHEKINFEIELKIIQQEENRELYVEFDSNILENPIISISKNFAIETFSKYFDPVSFYNSTYGYIRISKYTSENVKIIRGRAPNSNNLNEIIIPQNFSKNGYKFNSDNLLNQTITLKVPDKNNLDFQFEVVGIYENNESNTINELYASYIDINKENAVKKYVILLCNAKDTDKVIEELRNFGCIVELINNSTQKELNIYKDLIAIVDMFIYGLLLINIIIVCLIIKLFFNNQNKNIVIMKTLGYPVKIIIFNIMKSMILIITLSFLISTFLIWLCTLYNNIFLPLNVLLSFIIIYLLVIIVLIVVVALYYKKIKQISVVAIMHKTLW